MLNYREAPNYTELSDFRKFHAQKVKDSLILNTEFHQYSRAVLADVLGPLGTTQRWDYSLNIGFSPILRRNLNWEGPPDVVANGILTYAAEYGYPLSLNVAEYVVKTGESQEKPLDEPLNFTIRTSLNTVFGVIS